MRILSELTASLNDGGVFYMSFKYGDSEFNERGRYFNFMDDDDLFRQVVVKVPELKIEEIFVTEDVRDERKAEYWLNVFLVKSE